MNLPRKLNSSWESSCAQWAELLALSCSHNASALRVSFLLLGLCFFQTCFFVKVPDLPRGSNYRVFVGHFLPGRGSLVSLRGPCFLCVSGLWWDSAWTLQALVGAGFGQAGTPGSSECVWGHGLAGPARASSALHGLPPAALGTAGLL